MLLLARPVLLPGGCLPERSGFAGFGARTRCGSGQVSDPGRRLAARDLKLKPDPESIARQVVLLAEDGTITPLAFR